MSNTSTIFERRDDVMDDATQLRLRLVEGIAAISDAEVSSLLAFNAVNKPCCGNECLKKFNVTPLDFGRSTDLVTKCRDEMK